MTTPKLLSRDAFRVAVWQRDRHTCVLCGATDVPLDAHHILERRLWPDGGYYIDNGASLCEPCHLKAEQTLVSVEDLRERCDIKQIVLPPHLYQDQSYDKWANPILDNGQRLRGELFDDESVQKVLVPVLNLFTNRVKYPRTYHLPWSPGVGKDDRVADNPEGMFAGREVVITEKMDGENCTMYSDYIHARSLEFSPHASRAFVKAMWARIAHDIPTNWRVCGENLYAEHSIHYDALPAYFELFSVWNDKNICLSWDETCYWAALLGFEVVPVIFRGMWDEATVRKLIVRDGQEGYVVRLAESFHYKDFRRCVAKYVRANHVLHRDGHWSNRKIVPNSLKSAT